MQSKSASATSKANTALAAKGNQPFNPGPMPNYIPLNLGGIEKKAVNFDRQGFLMSDTDFAARHPGMLGAEKIAEGRILQDQKGESELSPQIQAEFMRAGLGNTLGAFGDQSGTLTPGGAGEASMARNLGLSIMGFQDRNRANRERSLAMGETLFPRRQFGLTGKDAANLEMANVANQNNFNQANYATQAGIAGTNMGIQQNAIAGQISQNNADAQSKAAMWGALASGIGKAAGGYAQYQGMQAGQNNGLQNSGYYTNPNAVVSAYGQGVTPMQYSPGNWIGTYA